MAKLRVFISSTCYDLGIVRSELRPFIELLGHTPVMSEHSDVLFDPDRHTHESCIKEVPACDIVVVIIGSRFGGVAIPRAIEMVNVDKLLEGHPKPLPNDQLENLSITQLEVLKALDEKVPIYTFVDSRVHHDHHLYEANKGDADIIERINFPSIQKQETAKYVFEFINFLRALPSNNAIYTYTGLDDIKRELKGQWSQKFQELLKNASLNKLRQRRFADFSEQIEDLKNVILVSIDQKELKEVGKGVLKYRRMIDVFGYVSKGNTFEAFLADVPFDEFLASIGIEKIVENRISPRDNDRPAGFSNDRTFIVMRDDSFFRTRMSSNLLMSLSNEWELFRKLSDDTKSAILESVLDVSDTRRPFGLTLEPGHYSELLEQAELGFTDEIDDE